MPGPTGQKIYKYDLQGNFITEYPSQQAASDIDRVPFSYISEHMKGKFSYCKGHIYSKKYYIKLPDEFLLHKSKRIYKTKQVHQYDLDGNFIKTYKSRREVFKSIKIGWRNLTDYLSGNSKSKSVGGFMWSYEKVEKLPKYQIKKNFKKIYQYTKDGKFVKSYNSLKEAAKELNILSSCITHCAKGNVKFPTYGGFIWRYEKLKDVKKVLPRKTPIEVYKNNKLVKIYESQREVNKELKISSTMIWKCLSGQKESANGYFLKYKNIV
jgi:hypothetical protein